MITNMGLGRSGGCTSGGWGISVSYLELMYKMKWVITTSDWRAVLTVSHPLTISTVAAITRLGLNLETGNTALDVRW